MLMFMLVLMLMSQCKPALRRKGLIIDLTDEDIFGYVQRVLTSAEVLFFPKKNSTIASGEVNTILFMSVRAFQ